MTTTMNTPCADAPGARTVLLSRSDVERLLTPYGFDVGRNVTKTLLERGYDARFVRGGVSAWYASGGPRALRPDAG